MAKKKDISQTRKDMGPPTLGVILTVLAQQLPMEAEVLTPEGEDQFEYVMAEVDDMTDIAREALKRMDPTVFENAPESMNTIEEVDALLAEIPDGYRKMLEEGRIQTVPKDYAIERNQSAVVRGSSTFWESDDVVVIPWDEKLKKFFMENESLPATLAHEFIHFKFGWHSPVFLYESNREQKERDKRNEVLPPHEWTQRAREVGDVPYLVGDLMTLIDEWGHGRTGPGGVPAEMDLARAYGLTRLDARILQKHSVEKAHERQSERIAEVRMESGEKSYIARR
jgi:hypothetical protein